MSSNFVELDLTGNQMVDLPSNSFSCSLPKLRELRLSYNKFTSFMIFQWVSNMSSNLIELHLSNNLFVAPPSYGYDTVMNSLQVLDLSNNKLKGKILKKTIIHNLSGGCVRNSL